MDTHAILVVDDSAEFLSMVEHVLTPIAEHYHCHLLHATDGTQALDLLSQHPEVAVLVTDLAMPGISGLELLEHCSQLYPPLQCVVLSSSNDSAAIRAALRAGACDYLVKPVTIDELENAIERALARHDALRHSLLARDRLYRIEQELTIAGDIQRHLLPPPVFRDPSHRVHIAAELIPARTVAGDFYDYWLISPKQLAICVGDVSGKGISAALWMAVARTLLRSHLQHHTSVSAALEAVNTTLARDNPHAYFVTVTVGVLDLTCGELTLCGAAHPAPFRLSSSGELTQLDVTPNMPLGAVESVSYTHTIHTLRKGDRLIFFTDGVTEAKTSDGDMIGVERLAQLIEKLVNHSATTALAEIIAWLTRSEALADSARDDVTLFIVDYCRPLHSVNVEHRERVHAS